VLCEVARCGSLTGAAEVLSYTPSAVSQQIAVLEREVGMALFERRARGVILTEAGRVLVEHANPILTRLEAAEAALSDLANLRLGRLRIASFATAGANILPRAMDLFRSRHPGVELVVEPASSGEGIVRLREGRIDLALTVDFAEVPGDDVEVVDLVRDVFLLALHRDHPLADQAEIRLEELTAETWIDVPRSASGGMVLRDACEQVGFEPRVAFESDDYTVIQELVATGMGLALLPELALCPPHEAVVLRSLGPRAPWRMVQAATRRAAFCSAAASMMLEVLLEVEPRRRVVSMS
jgi:DNA-binding transcriptional LysR family regulator